MGLDRIVRVRAENFRGYYRFWDDVTFRPVQARPATVAWVSS